MSAHAWHSHSSPHQVSETAPQLLNKSEHFYFFKKEVPNLFVSKTACKILEEDEKKMLLISVTKFCLQCSRTPHARHSDKFSRAGAEACLTLLTMFCKTSLIKKIKWSNFKCIGITTVLLLQSLQVHCIHNGISIETFLYLQLTHSLHFYLSLKIIWR